MKNATLVFAGPSVSAIEINQVLPHAYIHEPVRCGDIYKLTRLHPKRIIIIDGYYESELSVWHKEILHAMNEGIEVIGAASMGALRAAELYPFGMLGMGTIFNWFKQGTIDADDEVAVAHAPASLGYQPYNMALVDIRATLAHALKAGAVDTETHQRLLDVACHLFYPKRTIERIVTQVEQRYQCSLNKEKEWLENNVISLKHDDTIAALCYARDHSPKHRTSQHTTNTRFFQKFCFRQNISLFHKAYDWLPEQERHAMDFLTQNSYLKPFITEYGMCLQMALCLYNQTPFLSENGDLYQKTCNMIAQQKNKQKLNNQHQHTMFNFFSVYFFKTAHTANTPLNSILMRFVDLFLLLTNQLMDEVIIFNHDDYQAHKKNITQTKLQISNHQSLSALLAQTKLTQHELDWAIDRVILYFEYYRLLKGIPIDRLPQTPSYNWLIPIIKDIEDLDMIFF